MAEAADAVPVEVLLRAVVGLVDVERAVALRQAEASGAAEVRPAEVVPVVSAGAAELLDEADPVDSAEAVDGGASKSSWSGHIVSLHLQQVLVHIRKKITSAYQVLMLASFFY